MQIANRVLLAIVLSAAMDVPAAIAGSPSTIRVVKPTGDSGLVSGCFGASIAISGNLAFAGDPCKPSVDQSYVGAVYRLVHQGAGWVVDQHLGTEHPAYNGQFGASLSINGTSLAVGAPGEGSDGYVYQFSNIQAAQIGTPKTSEPVFPSPNAGYGTAVAPYAFSGQDFFVGAPSGACATADGRGFMQTASGYSSSYTCSLAVSQQDAFAMTLITRGNLALVGAPGFSGVTGSAYLYDLGIPMFEQPFVVSIVCAQ